MKRYVSLEKRKKNLGIAFGVLAAVAVLFSQSFYFNYLESIDTTSVEQTDERGDDTPVIKMAQDAVVSVAQIFIHQVLDYLGDISVGREIIKTEIPRTLRLDRYFQTLFNIIISPNAP
ncbi:MAG: hypothetical protein AAGF85_06330 [Bacteroidota bacterium]